MFHVSMLIYRYSKGERKHKKRSSCAEADVYPRVMRPAVTWPLSQLTAPPGGARDVYKTFIIKRIMILRRRYLHETYEA